MNEMISITAFIEGLLSFFSPCVLPLLPIYIGMLSRDSQGKKHLILRTVFFIFGILSAILLLNTSFLAFSSLLRNWGHILSLVSGIIIIIMALVQLDIIKITFLKQTFQLPIHFSSMNILTAYLMGFVFSFAWTPCVGTALTSIILLAGQSSSWMTSSILALFYGLGLSLPFLVVGFVGDIILKYLKQHQTTLMKGVKIGAILFLIAGIVMVEESIRFWPKQENTVIDEQNNLDNVGTTEKPVEDRNEHGDLKVPEIILNDLNGNEVNIRDYEGKVIFLNLWGTWCPSCKVELPAIEILQKRDDVHVITMVNGAYRESGIDAVKEYMDTNGYTFTVLYDTDGKYFYEFGIRAYPTTFMIDDEGYVFGYVEGALNEAVMHEIVDMTIEKRYPQQ